MRFGNTSDQYESYSDDGEQHKETHSGTSELLTPLIMLGLLAVSILAVVGTINYLGEYEDVSVHCTPEKEERKARTDIRRGR